MSSKNPRADKNMKRRKMREESHETKEETTSRDSSERSHNTEETTDPFRSQRVFDEVARDMTSRDWVRACKTFADKVFEIATDMDDMAKTNYSEERDPQAIMAVALDASLTLGSDQLKKTQRALREYSRRYLRALRDLNSERQEKEEIVRGSEEKEEKIRSLVEEKRIAEEEARKRDEEIWVVEEKWKRLAEEKQVMEEERKRLAKENREVMLERDRLRAALATRGERERGRRTTPPGTPSWRRWR